MVLNDFILETCCDELRIILTAVKDAQLKNQITMPLKCFSKSEINLNLIDANYPIHYFAFYNDWNQFLNYYFKNLESCSINETDLLGNTPLLIAIKMGHKDFVDTLIFLNADVMIKNKDGWSAIAEAISYGNINTVEALLKLFNIQNRRRITESHNQRVLKNESRDFIIDFSWNINTWIPFLSKFLPSDNCTLTKSGAKLRLDQTLMDFDNHKWSRGNISCIINPNISANPFHIYLLDNNKMVYQILNLYKDNVSREDLRTLMTSDIIDAKLNTNNVAYSPKTNFWSFNNNILKRQVGNFEAQMYDMNNITMTFKKRREHISKKQMELNKIEKREVQKGNFSIIKNSEYQLINLEPPLSPELTWDKYKQIESSTDSPNIGRKQILKTSTKDIKLCVGMSEEFPLEITEILDVFEMILPEKKVSRIREIFSMKMPPGFPVTLDIPILPTISANISFLSAHVGQPNLNIDENLFLIPEKYKLVKKI